MTKASNRSSNKGMEPFIFASYSHKDIEIVSRIIKELQMNGYRIWDYSDRPVGTSFPEYITEQLSGAAVILAFISNSSVDSGWCRLELQFAFRERKKIIPILLDGCSVRDLPVDIASIIDNLNCIRVDRVENIPDIVRQLNQDRSLRVARSMNYRQQGNESFSWPEFETPETEQENKSQAQECKVIFLGDGEAGKSSLIDRIIYDRFNPGFLPTDGIKMSKWETELDGSPFVLRFLDFGGQEILHSMHRCFLTAHTIYVVICESRNDTEIDSIAARWLETVKTYAPDCPVILALNKADLNNKVSVNEKYLRTVNPRLASVLRTSAAVGRKEKYGVRALLDAIWQEIPDCINRYEADADMMGVKRELEDMTEDYIDAETYKSICERHGIRDGAVQRSLLNWFKDLGVAYYYEPEKLDTLVSSVRVLNPAWLTNGIYRLILRTPDTGFLAHQEIKEALRATHPKDVLPDVVYEPDETEYILHVMEMFELSIEMENSVEMIPAKMSKTPPDRADQFPKENALHLQWKGNYLPNNLIHRLMIRKFPELDKQCVWRMGGRFEKADTQCIALAEMNDQSLDVYVTGEKNRRKYYMESFRDEIRMIMAGMGIKAEEMICYRIDGKEGHIPYDAAMDALEQGKKEIPLYDIKVYISPKKLINDIFPDEEKELTRYRQEKGDFSRYNNFASGSEKMLSIIIKLAAIVILLLIVFGFIKFANPDIIKSVVDLLKSLL